jgi:hypothetical protein
MDGKEEKVKDFNIYELSGTTGEMRGLYWICR